MVVEPLKKMGEDNDELLKLQQKDVENQEVKKTLEATCSIIERNLYINEMEIKNLRRRDMELHEDNRKRVSCPKKTEGSQLFLFIFFCIWVVLLKILVLS